MAGALNENRDVVVTQSGHFLEPSILKEMEDRYA